LTGNPSVKMAWIEIKNKSAESADLYLYEEIGFWGTLATNVRDELRTLDTKQINVHINSPGGSVFEGNAIYNLLRQHKARVSVYVDGIAASIASVIAMAGDEIIMAENSMMMIHDPIGSASGGSEEMRKMADVMDKIKDTIIAAYTRKTKKDAAELSQLMEAETWMSALDAVALGFADAIAEPIQVAAKFELSGFRNAPTEFKLTAKTSGKGEEPKIEEPKSRNMKDLITQVSAAFAGTDFKANAIEQAAAGKDMGDILASYVEHVSAITAELAANHEQAIADLVTAKDAEIEAVVDELANVRTELAETQAKLEAGGTDTGTGLSLLDQYNAITDHGAKTQFFRANKNALIAESKMKEGK